MKKYFLFSALFFSFSFLGFSADVYKKIYIKRGWLNSAIDVVTADSFTNILFCENDKFRGDRVIIQLNLNDKLHLTIVNHDSISHNFVLKSDVSTLKNIPTNDSATIVKDFTNSGSFVFYDDKDFPNNYYYGLSGLICVSDTQQVSGKFVWMLRDQYKKYNYFLDSSLNINWNDYDPDYFFINNKCFPEVESDSITQIVADSGKKFLLYITNCGVSAHSIHFHGYHGKVINTDAKNLKIGWIKDTFPFESMESATIEFVPDKSGIFPVHDHNLVAVSGGGRYPNGMLVMMRIK